MDELSNTGAVEINPPVGLRHYLVTYSEAGESTFFTRESFREICDALGDLVLLIQSMGVFHVF